MEATFHLYLIADQTLLWYKLCKTSWRLILGTSNYTQWQGLRREQQGPQPHTPPLKIRGCVNTFEKGGEGISIAMLCFEMKGSATQWYRVGLLWDMSWGWAGGHRVLTVWVRANSPTSGCRLPWPSLSGHGSQARNGIQHQGAMTRSWGVGPPPSQTSVCVG